MLVEDVLSPKSCNHSKSAKHSEMKETSSWEATSQEHNNSFWSRWKEALETFQVNLMLVMDDPKF